MGSVDLGRHGAKKRRVEAQDALKVSDLRRERIPPGATGFTVSYQLGEGADAKSVVERVGLDRVPASFGGTRTYFRCPGAGCGDGSWRCISWAGCFAVGAVTDSPMRATEKM